MEWVEKTPFICLNKLFEITIDKMNHQTFRIARNLLAIIREPQPYVLPIILRRRPMVVVHGKHFVLKDLPFYEEAHEANAKARQEHLDQREEKRQEGTLRRAPGDKRLAPFPPASAPANKKKKVPTKGIVISSSAPSGLPSVSSDSERIPGQNGSGLQFQRLNDWLFWLRKKPQWISPALPTRTRM